MKSHHIDMIDDPFAAADSSGGVDDTSEADLWFLPGPVEDEPDHPPLGPGAERKETAILAEWAQAQAEQAMRLAHVAGRLGALDERLRRGPKGWQHRLALIEASELSWHAGDRLSPDRLGLWLALHISGAQAERGALARAAWAVRRLAGGPGPEAGLGAFLDRRDPETIDENADPFTDRASSWLELMGTARDLHPISRACMGFHLWALAGLGQHGDGVEAAVTAARIAAGKGQGAVFVPLAMGGAGGLRVTGSPTERLSHWLQGMDSACLAAMRHLDAIEAWTLRAHTVMAPLSGRTPAALRTVLSEWPLVSAPMAEALTSASRAAVQRNLTWMEKNGLIREVTGQGRFRMWRIA